MFFSDQVWAPSVFTAPLSPDFRTDGDRLLELVDLVWSSPEQDSLILDDWQRALIRHILERYPDDHPDPEKAGRLRYRQVVISMARQNGKSVLAGILALYGMLMHRKGPEVIGVAHSVEGANIVYNRVAHVFMSNPALAKRWKATGTRGIRSRTAAGSYHVKAGKEESLQGVVASLGIYDELHISKEAGWDALVLGGSAQADGILVGITTAGDDQSTLLKRLYKQGKEAAAQDEGYDERFGFFCWEAPAHLPVDDPDAILAANPAVACGRRPLSEVLRIVRGLPENQARRYVLNNFVASASSWMPTSSWTNLTKSVLPKPATVFAVDRSDNWGYATITANVKHEGKVYTEVVASLTNPNVDRLEEMCVALSRKHPRCTFVMEAAVLKDLATRLRERGVNVEYLTQAQVMNACATTYAAIAEQRVIHAHDMVVAVQMPRAVAKNSGEGWRISRRDSAGDVDAVLATIFGIWAAENIKDKAPSLYIA